MLSVLSEQLQVQETLVALEYDPSKQSQVPNLQSTLSVLSVEQAILESSLTPGVLLPTTYTAVLPVSTATSVPTKTPLVSLPFDDNFDTGPRSEWRVVVGEHLVLNGMLGSVGESTAIKLQMFFLPLKLLNLIFIDRVCGMPMLR